MLLFKNHGAEAGATLEHTHTQLIATPIIPKFLQEELEGGRRYFDLKERFGLPEAVMSDNTIVFHEPVRMGDRLRTRQILRSVSDPKATKLGTGRFWVIDVEYLNQRDELVGVESYTGFGYRRAEADA